MVFAARSIIPKPYKCQIFFKYLEKVDTAHFCSSVNPRKFFVGGNMKMNGSKKDIKRIAESLSKESFGDDVNVVIAPPAPYLQLARKQFPAAISLAIQNCYKEASGAFTGEISPTMALEMGAKWVILGHSERRTIFKESDELIAEKFEKCLESKLNVIACVGENLEERESGVTSKVVIEQLKHILPHVNDCTKVVIAYEPVWAIGTGKVATPGQAEEVHCSIRQYIKQKFCPEVAKTIRIIYGGSVTGDNAERLAREVDIDGFLVGGASLKPEFVKIIQASRVKLCAKPSTKN